MFKTGNQGLDLTLAFKTLMNHSKDRFSVGHKQLVKVVISRLGVKQKM